MADTQNNLAVWLSTPHQAMIEIAHDIGYRHVVLDIEHGLFDLEAMDRIIALGKALGMTMHAKVLGPEAIPIQQALDMGADSVIITGTTTSGCVRATAVDAFSMNYRVALAEEGCFDRSQASHAMSLCDMHAKYADVVKTAEVLEFFASLPEGLFDLPAGSSAPAQRLAAE